MVTNHLEIEEQELQRSRRHRDSWPHFSLSQVKSQHFAFWLFMMILGIASMDVFLQDLNKM
jgi:hypothetical protein